MKVDLSSAPKVLIVEDDVDTLGFFELLFSGSGFIVWGACTSGERAVELCENSESPPDVVVLDYRLPGMDGVEVGKRLMEIDSTIEIILCTADDSARESAEAVGIYRFKTKPVENAHLVKNIVKAYKNKLRRT